MENQRRVPNYMVLLERDGERKYTYLNSEDDTCAFVLSLFEQDKVAKTTIENAAKSGGAPEMIQYTANDVSEFLDLNMADIAVLVKSDASPHSDGGGAGRASSKAAVVAPSYNSYDGEWLKQSICKYLIRQLVDDEDDGQH